MNKNLILSGVALSVLALACAPVFAQDCTTYQQALDTLEANGGKVVGAASYGGSAPQGKQLTGKGQFCGAPSARAGGCSTFVGARLTASMMRCALTRAAWSSPTRVITNPPWWPSCRSIPNSHNRLGTATGFG